MSNGLEHTDRTYSRACDLRASPIALLALLVGLCAPRSASAQEVMVGYGIGAKSCGAYLEQRRRPKAQFEDLAASWVQGFISAHNFYGVGSKQVNQHIDFKAALAYLDIYCRENPVASVSFAVGELIKVYK